MKKQLLALLLFIGFAFTTQAQYVTIPDSAFATWLYNHGNTQCVNGYLLDTTCIPVLTRSIMDCRGQDISSLEGVQYFKNLRQLYCDDNNIGYIPPLPDSLFLLACSVNQLYYLSKLPNGLKFLYCNDNYLSNLPNLPDSLLELDCSFNNLTSIPDIKRDSMGILSCNNNPQLNCLPKLPAMSEFDFKATGITCLPNYPVVNYSDQQLSVFPICDMFNPSGCQVFWNISGKSFVDINTNCIFDANEVSANNVKYELWRNGYMLQQAFSDAYDHYSFDIDSLGGYEVRIDTNYFPWNITCPPSHVYNDTITFVDSIFYNNDFALSCKPGFDVGVSSISSGQIFRPGNFTVVKINAGDITNFYSAHCAAGVAGVVSVTINGQANYISVASGAIPPNTVIGNTLTWSISDFGLSNALADFNIVVQTDSFALLGKQVCITVNVTPTAGDNNPANNTLTHCFNVVSSYDPNEKEVYPSGNIDTAQDWLTYTVHFQNTGTAEAQHIYVMDTLDVNVDEGSFQLLAYSHQPVIQINEKIVRFNFPNINLPDSTTDEPNSHGYVQYKVKLKQHLPIGTQISNTAYIYFDFNSPVVTNTVTNTVAVDTSVTIGIPTINKDAELAVTIYPNPANTQLTVAAGVPNGTIHIYSTEGKLLNTYAMQGTAQTINIETLASGIYYIEVSAQGQTARKKLVKL